MDDFILTLTPPNSFIRIQNQYEHQANMDNYTILSNLCGLPFEITHCYNTWWEYHFFTQITWVVSMDTEEYGKT